MGSQDLPTQQVPHAPVSGRVLVATVEGCVVRVELPSRGRLTVGRGADADVLLDHPSVSRKHVVLDINEHVQVEDQGSANGTILGGARLTPFTSVRFDVGSVLEIGAVLVLLGGAPEERQPPSQAATDHDSLMRDVREVATIAAQSKLSVLLLGETGVGKEVLAHLIHDASPRRDHPLVKINCAALVESLLEAELFGYERGAFTGANQAKPGLLEAADGGTLFLDEVGELPLATQAKLLRMIESSEVTRVGALKPRIVDVRFIAATHRDLSGLVAEGRFREDLLFRLDGVPIRVPPLRERTDEILSLAECFVNEAARSTGKAAPTLADDAKERLVAHAWPGNVRELRNVIQRSVLFCKSHVMGAEHLRFEGASAGRGATIPPAASSSTSVASVPAPPSTSSISGAANEGARAERRARVLAALDESQWNQVRAAARLGVSRRTLQTWMIDLGIPRPRAKS